MKPLKPITRITTSDMIKIARAVRRQYPSRLSFLTRYDKKLLTQLDQMIIRLEQYESWEYD